MEEKILECPFCGKKPIVDKEKGLVHCSTIDCAIGDFYIGIEEWQSRGQKREENLNKLILMNINDKGM